MSDEQTINSPRWYRTRNGQLLLAVAGIAGVYLLSEHWAHALPYLPWLVILACPLMHVFMHRGHGGHAGHGGHGGHGKPDEEQEQAQIENNDGANLDRPGDRGNHEA